MAEAAATLSIDPGVKPGYQTTEFWLTLVKTLVSLALASGAMAPQWQVQCVALLTAAAVVMKYAHDRASTKKAGGSFLQGISPMDIPELIGSALAAYHNAKTDPATAATQIKIDAATGLQVLNESKKAGRAAWWLPAALALLCFSAVACVSSDTKKLAAAVHQQIHRLRMENIQAPYITSAQIAAWQHDWDSMEASLADLDLSLNGVPRAVPAK